MALTLRVADAIARLAQKAPGSPRLKDDVAFVDIPARTLPVTIPTRHGDVAAPQYSPAGEAGGAGAYINLHGGGFVMRHPEQDDALCRFLAAKAGVTVVNVDYTPAPQLRAPGSAEQAQDVAAWAADGERGWDGTRIAIGGQSAGGALAAAASRLALETGGPDIRLQVLMYPVLDLTVSSSAKWTKGKEKFLIRMGPVFDTVYCPAPMARGDRLLSPAGGADVAALDGIAPALVITCGEDILRDEGARYASRLDRAHALVEHLDLPDVGHGFNLLGSPLDVVLPVYERIAEAIRQALR